MDTSSSRRPISAGHCWSRHPRLTAVVDDHATSPRPYSSTRARTTRATSNPQMIRAAAASSRRDTSPRSKPRGRASQHKEVSGRENARTASIVARGRRETCGVPEQRNFPELALSRLQPLATGGRAWLLLPTRLLREPFRPGFRLPECRAEGVRARISPGIRQRRPPTISERLSVEAPRTRWPASESYWWREAVFVSTCHTAVREYVPLFESPFPFVARARFN